MSRLDISVIDTQRIGFAEAVACALEEAVKDGAIYCGPAKQLAHTIRAIPDTDAEAALLRVVRAARQWRTYWGMPDRTDPSEFDPAVRRECEAHNELVDAVDCMMVRVELGSKE